MRKWKLSVGVAVLALVMFMAGTAAAVVTLPLTIVDLMTNGTVVGWFRKVPQARYINFLDGAAYNTSSKALEIGGLLDVGPVALPAAVASASTIVAPAGGNVFHVTGSVPVVNITSPFGTRSGCITAIFDAGDTTTAAGNIARASTILANQTLNECWDPATSKWYPNL